MSEQSGPSRDEPLVQLGVRVPRSLLHALQRASLKQKHAEKESQTQADIVAEAIRQWLDSNGYEG